MWRKSLGISKECCTPGQEGTCKEPSWLYCTETWNCKMRKSNRNIPDHCKGIQRNGMGLLELCWEWDTKTHIQQETEILRCVLTHIYLNAHSLALSPMRVLCYVLYFATDISSALKKSAGQRWYLKHSFFPAKVFEECVVESNSHDYVSLSKFF